MVNSKRWNAHSIPDLTGNTYVVTGATGGLGLASATEFASHGGRVIVTGRNIERLRAATEQVASAATSAQPESVQLDLASLASVREAATAIAELTSTVDVLLNNAGVMATPEATTEDGFELQIGTNHLGHFALTGLILQLIPHRETTGRVVSVASIAHKNGKIVVEDLSFKTRSYSPFAAYGQSKLANLLFTKELARRAEAANWNFIAAASHPGLSATNLFAAGPRMANNPLVKAGNKAMEVFVSQSAEDGALPSLFAATAPGIGTGDYYGPDGMFEIRGNPKKVSATSTANDESNAKALWEKSEELTGVHFDFAD